MISCSEEIVCPYCKSDQYVAMTLESYMCADCGSIDDEDL